MSLQDYPYATEKCSDGMYDTYVDIAAKLGKAARVCEVGVYKGESLRMWRDLFPEGVVAGVDCNPTSFWPDGTIRILSDQDSLLLPDLLRPHAAQWDLIVDDAGHDGNVSTRTFGILWPLVAPGGYFVLEDWHVGFPGYLGFDGSMVELAKAFIERLDRTGDCESVYYRFAMAVLRKKPAPALKSRLAQ